ncbi:unnamed protein product [Effrenium voratum]|nr:unnamed protein product [Effrenium voratum]
MGVQGFLPKNHGSVLQGTAALAPRHHLQTLQSNELEPAVPIPSSRASSTVALAVGGGLSLSAFTFTLGRKSRRPTRSIRRSTGTTLAPETVHEAPSPESQELDVQSCISCLERRQRPVLDVQFLYATPILRPGSSTERLPALSWQEEAAAIRESLGLEDRGTSEGSSTSYAFSSGNSRARMQVFVATVNILSRLASSCGSSGPSWWHIAAHGDPGTGRLILEDEDGAPQVVSMAAKAFTCQKPPLGVSVLACAGEQAGRALLAAGASFAIVATGQLRDSTARVFASHFYRRLHCACMISESEAPSHGPGLAVRVRSAFQVAKEALKTSGSAAVRADANQLLLLEGPGLAPAIPSSLSNRSCSSAASVWMPVATSPETVAQGSVKNLAPEEMEEGLSFSDCADTDTDFDSLNTEDCVSLTDEMASTISTCSRKTLPEDCEDFVGRGQDLQRFLQLLGAPGGRRVVVLHGACGIGKSALSAELCRFATAPGRRFAPACSMLHFGEQLESLGLAIGGQREQVRGRRRLAYVSLQHCVGDSVQGAATPCAHLMIFAAAAGLAMPADGVGRTCLLIDRAETEYGWEDRFVPELLDKHPQLCVLITRRSPLYRLEGEGGDRWKPVNVALGPLSDMEAAKLFLQRLHRPLFLSDFSRVSKAGEPLRPNEDLLCRIASMPALCACGGLPRSVVRLASEVTWELPSLLDLKPDRLKVLSISEVVDAVGPELTAHQN